jgi:carbon storage regulator
MLVLSRKPGERIVVPGCELVLTVLAINGKTVRLGISAPAEFAVHREEVRQRSAQQRDLPPAKGK